MLTFESKMGIPFPQKLAITDKPLNNQQQQQEPETFPYAPSEIDDTSSVGTIEPDDVK